MIRLFLIEHTQNAFHSLKSTPTRTLLTTLGVAIGVASVTAILALSSGITQIISRQVDALEGNVAVVRPGASVEKTSTFSSPILEQTYAASTLTEQDFTDINNLHGVEAAAPLMFVNGSIKAGTTAAKNSSILATTPELASIAGLPLRDGQFIDSVTNKDTVVVGSQLSVDLFGTDQSIGKTLKVRGQTFTVIGILKDMHDPINFNSVDFDHAAIISLESGKNFNQGIAHIQQIDVRAAGPKVLPNVMKEVDSTLTTNHLGEKDFTILTGSEITRPSSQFFSNLSTVMTVIAGISLLVGGIGIMNIMLVGVAERTREIGLRKSVGASSGNIIWQFLFESLIISLIGGILGYLGGYLVAFMISSFFTFNPAFTWQIAATALGTSLVVGVIFGLYPAVRAARKNPIESLRRYH